MIDVFRGSGFRVSIRATPGSIEVEFPVELTDEALATFDERETRPPSRRCGRSCPLGRSP